MIIDIHTHIGRLPNSPLHKLSFEKIRNLLLKEMKTSGISHAFVLPTYGKKDPEDIDLVLEHGLKIVKDTKALSILGSIDILNYKKTDLDRLDELLRKREIIGIKLYPGYQYFYPGNEKCHPIYKLCLKYDVPVIFHSGDTISYSNDAQIKYSHPLHIDEVAATFNDLKIVIAHLGNPWLIDCAEILYKNKNVYADLSGLIEGGNFNNDYGKVMRQRIKELIAYSSPRKLLYGTDWPIAKMADYIKFVKSLSISGQDLEFVFYKNAANLFKLKI